MPMPYVWGWIVVAAGATGVVFALQRVLRDWDAPLVKALVGWWLFVVLLIPAQIPRHVDHFAPALIVFSFEALFQRDGNPGAAGRILAAASVLALILGLTTFLVGRSRRRAAAK